VALAVGSAAGPLVPDIDLGDPGLAFADPVRSGNLIVWPVVPGPDATPVRGVNYRSLDLALESGTVEVLETGEVQQLTLVNHGDEPVLLLAGEVLDGGKQDRIVAHDTVVEPKQSAPLASFCVEQSRWSSEAGDASGGARFKSGKALVAAPVREAAQVYGEQQAVWANVSNVNTLNACAPSTGTYMAVVEDEQVQAQVDARARGLLGHLAQHANAVGFVAALDLGLENELVVAEVFGTSGLFQAYRDKLVRTYALDALTREKGAQAPPTPHGVGLSRFSATPGVQSLDLSGFDPGNLAQVSYSARLAGADREHYLPLATVSSPHVTVSDERIEAGHADWKHLHRTIYKRAAGSPDAANDRR
jgi:hypothetical protein